MSDLPSVTVVASIEKRLAGVERSLRAWRFGCAALALVAVGVAADGGAVVKDAEFGTVKAKRFSVVGSNGKELGAFALGTTNGEHAAFFISDAAATQLTLLLPGAEPTIKAK